MKKSWCDAAALAALFLLSCADDKTKLAATGSGDLSNLLTSRTQADAALAAACGDGSALNNQAVFRRKPYVQQVTEQGAQVLFTTLKTAAFKVEITRPDGKLIAEVPASEVANQSPPQAAALYEARIAALEAGTVYCYSIPGVTARAGFRTAPRAQSGTSTRFVVFGDSGTGDSYQRAVFEQIQTVPYDLVLHTGDVAYGSGQPLELERNFFDVYGAMTKSFPVYPVSGNHDYKTAQAQPLLNAFSLPETAPPGSEERFYSFDWGDVHFVGLDTERMTPQQATWLDRDLAQNTRDWVVVFAHKPPYSSGEHGSSNTFRKVFGPVLEKHRVPLVLSGHEHNYERTRPIGGVTYIVTGGGGRETRSVGKSSYTAYSEDVLHFVYVQVNGRELVLHAIDGVGREFDSARIQRS